VDSGCVLAAARGGLTRATAGEYAEGELAVEAFDAVLDCLGTLERAEKETPEDEGTKRKVELTTTGRPRGAARVRCRLTLAQ
jgi:hypothetical protein